MVISDSMLRKLQDTDIKDTKIEARPGSRFATMYKTIRTGRIAVMGYKVVCMMLGTNDIDNIVYSQYGPVGYKLKMKNHHAPDKEVTLLPRSIIMLYKTNPK